MYVSLHLVLLVLFFFSPGQFHIPPLVHKLTVDFCLNERRCLLPLALPSQTVKNIAFMLHFLLDFSAVMPSLQAKPLFP